MRGPDAAYYERVGRWSSSERYDSEVGALLGMMGLRPGDRVLDIGCATGAATRLLRRAGVGAVGLDAGEAWIRFCPDRPAVRADAACLPFRDSSFEAATLMHSLAHIGRPLEALRELRRVVVPGGRVGIATPNRAHVRTLGLGRRRAYVPDPTVERHFGLGALLRLLRRADLEPVQALRWGPVAPLVPLPVTRERLLVVARRAWTTDPSRRT